MEDSSEDGFWTQQDSCTRDLMGAVAANTETAHSSHTKSQHGGVGLKRYESLMSIGRGRVHL